MTHRSELKQTPTLDQQLDMLRTIFEENSFYITHEKIEAAIKVLTSVSTQVKSPKVIGVLIDYLNLLIKIGPIQLTLRLKLSAKDKTTALASIKKQFTGMAYQAFLVSATPNDDAGFRWNLKANEISKMIATEFKSENMPWYIANADIAGESYFYATPKQPLTKKKAKKYLALLLNKEFDARLDPETNELRVYNLLKIDDSKSSSNEQTKRYVLRFPEPTTFCFSDGWNEKEYEISFDDARKKLKLPWQNSLQVDSSKPLSPEELKIFSAIADPIKETELRRLSAQAIDSFGKIVLTLIDSTRGFAARTRENHVIRAGQCVAIGGGINGKQIEEFKDYAWAIPNTGQQFHPQNLAGLFLHAPSDDKDSEENTIHHIDSINLDNSVDRMKLVYCNVKRIWRLYNNIPVAIFIAEKDIQGYLATNYGQAWWKYRNIVPDLFYQHGPMLTPALQKPKSITLIITTKNENESVTMDREQLMSNLHSNTTINCSNETICYRLSTKVLQQLLVPLPRTYSVTLPESAIESILKNSEFIPYHTSQTQAPAKASLPETKVDNAAKLRKASAPSTGIKNAEPLPDLDSYKKLVAKVQEEKLINEPSALNGRTALHWAALAGNSDHINVLIEAKADQTLKDIHKQTPFQIAQDQKHPKEILSLFSCYLEASNELQRATMR